MGYLFLKIKEIFLFIKQRHEPTTNIGKENNFEKIICYVLFSNTVTAIITFVVYTVR